MRSPTGDDDPRTPKVNAWLNATAALVGAVALPCLVFFGLDAEASVLGVIGVAILGAVIGLAVVHQ